MRSAFGTRQIMGAAHYEIKAQTRSIGFWAAIAVVNVFVFSMRKDIFHSTGAGIFEGYPQVLSVASLMFMMLYASALGRSRAERADEYIDSLGFGGHQMVLGQFLGVSALFCLLGLEVTGLLAALLNIRGASPLDWGTIIRAFILIFIPLLIFTAGLGMAVGAAFRSPLIAYPVLVALWLCMTIIVPAAVPQLGFLDPSGYMWLGTLPFSDMVGLFPNEGLARLSRLFTLFLGAATLVATALFYKAWRESRSGSCGSLSRKSLRIVCVASLLVLTLLPAGLFLSTWAGRYDIYRENLALAKREWTAHADGISGQVDGTSAQVGGIPRGEILIPQVVSYDLTVSLNPDKHGLNSQARMKFRLPSAKGGTIPGRWAGFTLHHAFSVSSAYAAYAAAGPEGQGLRQTPVPFRRDGDFLLINTEKVTAAEGGVDTGTIEVVLNYSGKVWNWHFAPTVPKLSPVDFVAREATAIQPGSAWYPLPGLEETAAISTWNTWRGHTEFAIPKSISHPNAQFCVTVETPGDNPIITGLDLITEESMSTSGRRFTFESSEARDIFLYAFPWEKRSLAGIECYIRRGQAEESEGAARYVAERISFYRDLLGQDGYAGGEIRLVEIPDRLLESPSLRLPGTIWLTEGTMNALRRNQESPSPGTEWGALVLNQEIASLWWPDSVRTMSNHLRGTFDEIADGAFWYTLALGAEKFIGPDAYPELARYWTNVPQPVNATDAALQVDPPIRLWVNRSPDGITSAIFTAFHRIRKDFGYDAVARVLRRYCALANGRSRSAISERYSRYSEQCFDSLADLNSAISDALGSSIDSSHYTKGIQESLEKLLHRLRPQVIRVKEADNNGTQD